MVGDSPPSFALLHFDLVSQYPPNATLLAAHLVLNQMASPDGPNNFATPQPVELRQVLGPWTEAQVNWTSRPPIALGPFSSLDATPGFRSVLNWSITDTVRTVYDQQSNRTAPHYGWAVVTAPPPVAVGTSIPFTFYSSNQVEAQRLLRPHLALLLELNGPRLQNLTVNGRQNGTYAPGVPAWFQVETQDPLGRVVSVKVQVKDDRGVVLEEVPLAPSEKVNLTRLPDGTVRGDERNPYRYWTTNHTLVTPAQNRFRLDVEARDNDGNVVNVTLAKRWGMRLDLQPPQALDVQVTPATLRLDEGGLVNVTAFLGDNEGVENGTLVLTHASGKRLEVPMKPLNLRRYVNTTYAAEFRLLDPGLWSAEVRVVDRSNVVGNATPFTLTVRDISPPALGPPSVGTARGENGGELGVPLVVSIPASDASALTVFLRLTAPSGFPKEHVLPALGAGRYGMSLVLDEVGVWSLKFIARDAGNLTRETEEALTFRVDPSEAPRVQLMLGPLVDGWVNGTPRLVLGVFDPNLDPASIRADVYVDDVLQAPVSFSVQPTAGGALATFDLTLAGARVVLALRANDTLGNALEAPVTYAWRVDRSLPSTAYDVAPAVGLGGDAHQVSPHTRITLTPKDTGSGVAATRWRLATDPAGSARTYRAPFALPASAAGTVDLLFWSEDIAGNREETHTVRLTVLRAPPAVQMTLEAGSLVGTATPTTAGVDVANLTVYVHTDLLGWRALASSVQVDGVTGAWTFRAVPPAEASGVRVSYAARAVDVLGNANFAPDAPVALGFYTSGNHAPTAALVAPAVGERVRDSVSVSWVAADVDGGALDVTVRVRGTRLAETVTLVTGGPSRGEAAWDTRSLPNGVYEVLVTVTDASGASAEARRLVHVDNDRGAALPAGELTVKGKAGEPFAVRARVNQDAKAVTLVLRGPEEVRVPLFDDGRHDDGRENDGVYGATVELAADGTYEGTYELVTADGTTLQGARTLKVTADAGGLLTPGAGGLAALAALGAAVLAMRRRA